MHDRWAGGREPSRFGGYVAPFGAVETRGQNTAAAGPPVTIAGAPGHGGGTAAVVDDDEQSNCSSLVFSISTNASSLVYSVNTATSGPVPDAAVRSAESSTVPSASFPPVASIQPQLPPRHLSSDGLGGRRVGSAMRRVPSMAETAEWKAALLPSLEDSNAEDLPSSVSIAKAGRGVPETTAEASDDDTSRSFKEETSQLVDREVDEEGEAVDDDSSDWYFRGGERMEKGRRSRRFGDVQKSSQTEAIPPPNVGDTKQIAVLTDALMSLKLEVAELRSELDGASQRCHNVEASNAALTKSLEAVTSERDEAFREARRWHARSKNLEQTISAMRADAEKTTKEMDRLHRRLKKAEGESDKFSVQSDAVELNCDLEKKERKRIERKCVMLREQRDRLARDCRWIGSSLQSYWTLGSSGVLLPSVSEVKHSGSSESGRQVSLSHEVGIGDKVGEEDKQREKGAMKTSCAEGVSDETGRHLQTYTEGHHLDEEEIKDISEEDIKDIFEMMRELRLLDCRNEDDRSVSSRIMSNLDKRGFWASVSRTMRISKSNGINRSFESAKSSDSAPLPMPSLELNLPHDEEGSVLTLDNTDHSYPIAPQRKEQYMASKGLSQKQRRSWFGANDSEDDESDDEYVPHDKKWSVLAFSHSTHSEPSALQRKRQDIASKESSHKQRRSWFGAADSDVESDEENVSKSAGLDLSAHSGASGVGRQLDQMLGKIVRPGKVHQEDKSIKSDPDDTTSVDMGRRNNPLLSFEEKHARGNKAHLSPENHGHPPPQDDIKEQPKPLGRLFGGGKQENGRKRNDSISTEEYEALGKEAGKRDSAMQKRKLPGGIQFL